MKNVILTIRGLLGSAEDDQEITLVTEGEYEYVNGVATFSYLESELTGLEGTKTGFHVEDEFVVVNRTGTINMEMMFHEGEKHYVMYETPIGHMTMGVDTQYIHNLLGEDGGDLEVRYIMDFGGAMVSRNCLEVNVAPVQ